MRAKKREDNRKKLVWQNAMYEASLQNGFLRVCWDEAIQSVSPLLYDFRKSFGVPLKALRLIGIGLTEIPDELSLSLPELEILSVANNHITSLPENIATLTLLRELNVMHNKLTKLPSRIGYMCSLQKLGVANNCLEVLPPSFGALNILERVDLEHNCLTVLPENLDNLLCCKTLNVNNNELVRLPRCVGRMPSLTSLSASCNNLTYIPSQLTMSTTLTCLRLNVNQIGMLPDRFGDLTQLQELNLDYNRLGKLPVTFWKLSSLKVLRMEGNDALLDPPPEVLGRGGEAVVRYCRAQHVDDSHARRRELVMMVQQVLRQIQERELADPALFEPDVQRDEANEKDLDRWFALQLPYLWRDLLPQLKRVWDAERNDPQQRREKKKKGRSEELSSFDFTELEAMQALTAYSDAAGPILRSEKAKFRRCACVNAQGQRQPCVPPAPGYMCLRDCVLLKADLVREREKRDRLWNAYKTDGMRDAVKRAEYESRLYLDSAEGQLWLEDTAYEQAEEVLLEGGANAMVEKRYRELENRKRKVVQKYDRQKERVQRSRDQKMAHLESSLAQLKEDKRLAKEGYVRNAVEQRIQALTVKLANLPETAQLLQIQEDCERDCALLGEGLYDSDSVNTSEVGSSDYSTDDDSPEARRWREKLERRDEGRLRRESNRVAKQRFGVDLPEKAEKGALAQAQALVTAYVVDPVLKPAAETVSYHASKLKKKLRRGVRQAVEVATIRVRRMYLKSNGQFDEIQRELKYEIYRQYVDHHVQLAREKARREFSVIESVRTNMEGMSRSKAFRAWKYWVVTKKRRIRKDLRKRWKMDTRGFDAAMHSVASAQFQVDLWMKNKDIYTDQVYWRNEVNGNITYDQPGLHHYLPPNFQIPVPPVDLPPDVPLETSSSDDSAAEDWLERYEQRQRAKRDQQHLLDLALHSRRRSFRAREGESDSSSESEGRSRPENPGSTASSSIHWEKSAFNAIPRVADVDQESAYGEFSADGGSARSSSYGQLVEDRPATSAGLPVIGAGMGSGRTRSSAASSSGSSSGSSSTGGSSGSCSQSAADPSEGITAGSDQKSLTRLESAATIPVLAVNNGDGAEGAITGQVEGQVSFETLPAQYEGGSDYASAPVGELQDSSWGLPYHQASGWESAVPLTSEPRWPASYDGHQAVDASAVVRHAAQSHWTDRSTSQCTGERAAAVSATEQAPEELPVKLVRYTFKGLLNKYGAVSNEGEEEYVGAVNSAAAARLIEAIEFAREYMQTNRQYLLRNQLRAIGGGTSKSVSSKRRGSTEEDLDARAAAHQPIDLHAQPSDLYEEAAIIRQKALQEYEAAFKAIRKKRNQLNVQRHHTYMHQMNRKPKSLEMHREEMAAGRLKAQEGSEEELMQRIEDFISASGKVTGQYRAPSEEELLRLAGGDKEMVLTGKAGMELRTVLAQRALLVKKKLEQQAAERGIIKQKKSNTFWGREIRPLLLDKYQGSSSEEEDADEERKTRRAKEARQRQRRERRADRAFMSEKLGAVGSPGLQK